VQIENWNRENLVHALNPTGISNAFNIINKEYINMLEVIQLQESEQSNLQTQIINMHVNPKVLK
jgi:hypothetical protein